MELSREEQREINRETYLTRAHLFKERAKALKDDILQLISYLENYEEPIEWEKEELGISKESFSKIAKLNVPPQLVFCHPDVLRNNLALAGYYRLLAIIPEKGLQRLGAKPGKKKNLIPFCRLVNESISEYIEHHLEDESILKYDLLNLIFLQFGAQMEGTWRNVIGSKGMLLLKRELIQWFSGLKEEIRTEPYFKTDDLLKEDGLSNLEKVYIIEAATKKYSIEFTSEPDVKITRKFNGSEKIVCWIEVKSGTDPAGAQERYGAAKKSLEKAISHMDRPRKILIMAVYTSAVVEMMETDRLVDEYYNLLKILRESDEQTRFFSNLKLYLGI